MNNPVHKVKRWVTYDDGREPHWTDDTAVGWLATGVIDKNGVEIHEGNIVRYWVGDEEIKCEVEFGEGAFLLFEDGVFLKSLEEFYGDELEIIGHIAEGVCK